MPHDSGNATIVRGADRSVGAPAQAPPADPPAPPKTSVILAVSPFTATCFRIEKPPIHGAHPLPPPPAVTLPPCSGSQCTSLCRAPLCRAHFLPGILHTLHEHRRFNDLGRDCCFEWDACDRGTVRTPRTAEAALRSGMDGFLGVPHIPRGISSPRGRGPRFSVPLKCRFLHVFAP